jgi:lysophospholipase L1-like esterase
MKYGLLALLMLSATALGAPKFELVDGDRVVFIGNAFIERDIHHNYLETLLTNHFSDRNVIFRNLGWSGDTVFVPARAGSGPNRGVDLLVEYVKDLRPTVIFVAYGMNESFEGEAGLSRFVDGYNKLLDALLVTKARVVLISPIRHEDLGRPLPDPTEHNRQLGQYTREIAKIATQRGLLFINLFDRMNEARLKMNKPLTENGIHLSAMGYFIAAVSIMRELELGGGPAVGIREVPGDLQLSDARLEKLRQAIRQKNVFFFDRYRPQNDMYIFHGRKHEQGRNAVEIPQFDKFIAEKEAEIAQLKRAK